jgi:hypothetical protein
MEEGLMVSLMNKAGELGMLSITIPEEYRWNGRIVQHKLPW